VKSTAIFLTLTRSWCFFWLWNERMKLRRLQFPNRHAKPLESFARSCANLNHLEACGVFYVVGRTIHPRVTFNFTRKPGSFAIQRREFAHLKNMYLKWGIWHSHPISPAQPSAGDLQVGDDLLADLLIFDVVGGEWRYWELSKTKLTEIDLSFL